MASEISRTAFHVMELIDICIKGIKSFLKDSDDREVARPHRISQKVLSCLGGIMLYLQLLYTTSLGTFQLPIDWKLAYVFHVHRGGGSNRNALNFRPIALTSVWCKLGKHILYGQVVQHSNSKNFLIPEQHWFRRGFSGTRERIEIYFELSCGTDVEEALTVFSEIIKSIRRCITLSFNSSIKILHIYTDILVWIGEDLSSRQQYLVLNGQTAISGQ